MIGNTANAGGTSVLLLRLAGPLQSWGIASKFETRDTASMPTKSGVCGLLAAALGRTRDSDNSDLAGLWFGVRADREGVLLDEFQMVRNTEFPDGQAKLYKKLYGVSSKEYSNVVHKHYLMDAMFMAGFEGNFEFLQEIAGALVHPVFIPYLGRRCCPPDGRLFYGIRDGDLESVLASEPPLCQWNDGQARYQVDSRDGHGMIMHDVPVSYDPECRKYGYRRVVEGYFHVGSGMEDSCAEHDPMSCLEPEWKGGVGADVPVEDMA